MMLDLNQIDLPLKEFILHESKRVYPQEMCGYLIKADRLFFYPCQNIHDDKVNNFAISEIDYVDASKLGEIVALIHSHPDANVLNGKLDFSEADRVACEKINLPWLLVVLPTEEFKLIHPTGYKSPLLGREFVYGVLDCYSLVKDAFEQIGIKLNDYPRGNIKDLTDNSNWNMFYENFANEDFLEIPVNSKLKQFDVLLMEIESNKINHIGLMWEPDSNIFIHQRIDRPSTREVYGGFWKRSTVTVVRHKLLW